MLLRSTLVVMFALPALISGSVVRRRDAHDLKNLARASTGDALIPPTRTPGKLRVVENSGICGEVVLFVMRPLSYSHFWQKLRQMSIRLPDTVISLRIRALGLCSTLSVPS